MATLEWDFDGEGMWQSASWKRFDGGMRQYILIVCEDGTYDVSESDQELIGKYPPKCFPTLADAKAWCESQERGLREGV